MKSSQKIRAFLPLIILTVFMSACTSSATPTATEKTSPKISSSPEIEITTPPPTPVPTEKVDPLEIRAKEILSSMSLEEKICQLLIIRPEALGGEHPTVSADETLKNTLQKFGVGGIVLTTVNLETREQTAELINALGASSKIGLFIAADEEGGNVARLMDKLGTTKLNSMYSYKDEGVDVAYQNAETIGTDMIGCGFNTDFAPVADVWTNPNNTVIGSRAYSDNYQEAAELVASAVRGFIDSGVVCCLKHFPGHGDTAEDSHKSAAVLHKTKEELMAGELLPFYSGIEAGAEMVMVGHMTVPAIDERPASMSEKIVTDLLRGEMGFEGVIVCDSVEMTSVGFLEEPERCLRIMRAGVDIIIGVSDVEKTVGRLIAAVESGEYDISALDSSVYRVLRLKLEHGIAS